MLEINWAPIVGALVITKKPGMRWAPRCNKPWPPAATKAGAQIRAKARQEVDDAVDAMKNAASPSTAPTPNRCAEWNELADRLYPAYRGSMVPADTFDEVMAHLKGLPRQQGQTTVSAADQLPDQPPSPQRWRQWLSQWDDGWPRRPCC